MTAPAAPKRPGNRPGPAVQDRPVAKKAAPEAPAKKAAPAENNEVQKTSTANKGPSAKGLSCLCGCGQPTKTDAAKFIPGHDARLKSLLLKIERQEDGKKKSDVPEIAKPFLQKSKMSGAWSFPTESGNTPDEDRFGKTFADRKEDIAAEKAAKKAKNDERLAKLKAGKKTAAKKTSDEDEPEGDEPEEEEEE
jgi:hypothetical protein